MTETGARKGPYNHMAAKKKASGRNVKESERGTEAKKFRLGQETAEDIETWAEKIGCSQSRFVEIAVELFSKVADRSDMYDLVQDLMELASANTEADEEEAMDQSGTLPEDGNG